MPKCRICGCNFKISKNSGNEICSKEECFKTAWRQVRELFGKAPVSKRHRKYRERISEEDKRCIIEMFDSGISRAVIAEKTHIPYQTVTKTIRNRSD